MKTTIRRLTGLLGLAVSCQVPLVMAATNTCAWLAGSGTMTFHQDMGSVFVPQDAPVGSVIGRARQHKRTNNNESLSMYCDNDGSTRLTFNAQTAVPFFPGVLPGTGTRSTTHTTLKTNINGVGVQIELGFPFAGGADNAFVPDMGDSTVPFTAHHEKTMGSTQMFFSQLESYITLVKTGDIAPGPQPLNGQELFSGSFSGIPGKTFGVGLTGTVIQAHCGSNRVSADPVQLGDWNMSDFAGPDYTTTPIPFKITLSSCVADDKNVNIATANIHFEGVSGSLPVNPPIPGVFSLTSDSTAQGMGIQILRADGATPVALNTEVPILPIAVGDTVLDFTARFYQTAASRDIRPGSAKGALNFTLTYK